MVQQSQYGNPIFIIPKKEGTERFITDYFRLNRKLVKKTHPLPRIGDTMQQIEGFQHANTLDLNMGYYTIIIFTAIQETTTIVTKFWKFRYNRLPTGMCALGYIFQATVDKLLSDNEGFKMYIDDILVLIKDLFTKHIEQLRKILSRSRAAGLKVNAPKYSFGLKEITYLG